MRNTTFIYHHLGLGDHIICNGLVRYYTKMYGEVLIPCKPHNFDQVQYMYRDNPNINILSIGDDSEVEKFILSNGIQDNVIKVGFEKLSGIKTFDEEFYESIGLEFNVRFDEFFFLRDKEKETEIFEKYVSSDEKYIFIHGNLDRNKFRNDLKIVENPPEYKIFDLLKIIENAEEVHLMESSIKCLVNSYLFEKPKFFYHEYVRGYTEWYNSKGKNKFSKIV